MIGKIVRISVTDSECSPIKRDDPPKWTQSSHPWHLVLPSHKSRNSRCSAFYLSCRFTYKAIQCRWRRTSQTLLCLPLVRSKSLLSTSSKNCSRKSLSASRPLSTTARKHIDSSKPSPQPLIAYLARWPTSNPHNSNSVFLYSSLT